MTEERLERIRGLMMGALDGELGDAERRELNDALATDPSLHTEFERLTRMKEVTGMMTLQNPPDTVWRGYWSAVYNRIERGIAWILVSVGATVLFGYGAWELTKQLWEASNVPGPVKVAAFALIVGLFMLLLSVGRERLFKARNNPYKDITQ